MKKMNENDINFAKWLESKGVNIKDEVKKQFGEEADEMYNTFFSKLENMTKREVEQIKTYLETPPEEREEVNELD